jgi:hypothetical protein
MTSLDTFKELGADFGTSLTEAALKKADVLWCAIKDADLKVLAKQTFYASATEAQALKKASLAEASKA